MIAVLLLLTYVGQSLLVTGAPCATIDAEAVDMSHAGHTGHVADSAEQMDSDNSGCCEGGYCSMSHCQSAVALPADTTISRWVYPAGLFDSSISPAPDYIAAALYRPPIIR